MPSFLLDTSHFELVRVSGADAERFLQGQLTCDVAVLPDGGFCFGAACNNKGRVIASFVLHRRAQDFVLIFRQGLATAFTSALRKFLPFYKCSMAQDTQLACLGLGGDDLAWDGIDQVPDVQRMHIGDEPRLDLLLAAPPAIEQIAALCSNATVDEGTSWQAAWIRAGHFPFDANDSEAYTPQELDFEQKGYISFTKGCYTGQEIVARMHYRGKIKRRLYRVELALPPDALPATLELLDDSNQVLATCLKLTPAADAQCVALASLPVETTSTPQQLRTNTGTVAHICAF